MAELVICKKVFADVGGSVEEAFADVSGSVEKVLVEEGE